jgi:hypothetical protein
MIRRLLYTLALVLLMLNATAQDTREQQLEKIRIELNNYVSKQQNLPADAALEKKIQQVLAAKEKDTLPTAKERYEQVKIFFITNQFWNDHPDYKALAAKKNVGSIRNLCNNGGFELGNTAFTHSLGFFLGGGSNNCAFAANSLAFNPTLPTSPTNQVLHEMEVVSNGTDANAGPSLPKTHSGTKALRLNSDQNFSGNYCNGFNGEVDIASVTFKVDAAVAKLQFWYAVVLEEPNHAELSGNNPFFTVRLRDEVTGALQTICVDPSQTNLFQYNDNCQGAGIPGSWQPWRCASFNLLQSIDHEVTLEFIAVDCGRTGHYGYAYIDDICTGCDDPQFGGVTITANDACFTDGYQFRGTYAAPSGPGVTLSAIYARLWSNGILLNTTIPVTAANGSYTGTVPFNLLTPGTSYDLMIIAVYMTPGGQQIFYNELVPGTNNDFTANAGLCCIPPRTGSPGFTITAGIGASSGQLLARATGLQPANHWWCLMETSIQGNTSDATTIGAAGPIQSGMGLTNVTFIIADRCKAYYIKHGVWLDGCFFWQELRLPVEVVSGITNRFNFEEVNNEPRNGFCFGEDIYLDARTSAGQAAWLLEIARRPINSSSAFISYARLGWSSSSLSNRINISQQFAAQNPPLYFEPGYVYKATLSLTAAANCTGAATRTDTFRVTCCTQTANAAFKPTLTNTGNTYNILASQLNAFTGPYSGARHQWIISSSPNITGGPYSVISQTALPGFTYLNAQRGIYYFILHRIFTPCGNFCDAQIVFVDNKGKTTILPGDCNMLSTIWAICDTPINTRSNCRNNTISWDAVPSVTGYQVEITLNDPSCCAGSTGVPVVSIYTVTGTSFSVASVPNLPNGCFSWRVRSVCGNGQSKWTQPACYKCSIVIENPGPVVVPPKVKG